MQNLLNNRWLIIALALLAVLMLVRSIMLSLNTGPVLDDYTDTYDWLENSGSGETVVTKPATLQTATTGDIFWNTHPRRDPFSPNRLIHSRDVRTIQYQAKTKSGDISDRQPVLSALVAGQMSRFAIIDGKIVEEGDSIGKFKVGQIARDGVWLHTQGRSFKLNLARQAQ